MSFHFNLTAIVAVLALADLVVDRLLARLFLPVAQVARSQAWYLSCAASFVSYLGGALALLVFATSFHGLIRRRELFPRSLRMVASILAVFFVLLFVAAVSSYPASPRLFIQLRTSQAFFAWVIILAIWRVPVPARTRLGVSLFMLPAIFHTAALFAGEAASTRAGAWPGQLARVGELIAFIAAGGAPLLLPGRLRAQRPTLLAFTLAAIAVLLLGLLAALKFDLLQLLALYGLRLELPPLAVPGAWAYLLLLGLALFGVVSAVIPALRAGGSERLVAYGLIMIVSAGYQISSPADLAVSTAGLLALAVGISRRGGTQAAPAPGDPLANEDQSPPLSPSPRPPGTMAMPNRGLSLRGSP